MKRLLLFVWMAALAVLATALAAQAQDIGPGYALSFNGTSQFVAVPNQSALDAFPLTVMAWFQDTGAGGALVNKYLSSSYNGWQIFVNGTNLQAWYIRDRSDLVYTNASGAGLTAPLPGDGLWHHAAFVVNANGGYLYVDGILKSNINWIGASGAVTTSQNLEMGLYPPSDYYQGQLDEVSIWNVALTQSQIATYMNQSLSNNETGLVAYYRFDDGSGTTATNATSAGSAYNGALNSGPTWVQSTAPIGVPAVSSPLGAISIGPTFAVVTGVVSPFYQATSAEFLLGTSSNFFTYTYHLGLPGCLQFDGLTSYVEIQNPVLGANPPNLNFTGPFSIECWINVTAFNENWQAIVTKGDSSWRLHRNSGNNSLAFSTTGLSPSGSTDPDLAGTRNVADGHWHHVAAVYDGANKYLYVDGTLDASTAVTGTLALNTFPVEIGENAEQTARIWDGKIDEVRLWSAALSQTTISNWMWQGVTSRHPNFAHLAGYWTMNDNNVADLTVADLSGNTNIGIATGNIVWTTGQTLTNEVMGFYFPSLVDGTQYYYQLQANNTAGLTVGPVVPFKTVGLFGQVTSGGLGVPNATVSGSSFSAVTDTNGNYSGSGSAQTLHVTKTGVTFTPSSQTATPGVAANFTVALGTIQGTISGLASGLSNVTVNAIYVSGFSPCSTTSGTNGQFTLCSLNDDGPGNYYRIIPSKPGYHFTPAYVDTYPGVDVSFVVSSKPPSLITFGTTPEPQDTMVITNSFNIALGDVPYTGLTITVTGSSNPALVPFNPANFQIVNVLNESPSFVDYELLIHPNPGAVGESTIGLSVSDGINPPVTGTENVLVQSTPQTPVAGMPYALNFDGTNNEVVNGNLQNPPAGEMTVEFWQYASPLNKTTPTTTFTMPYMAPNQAALQGVNQVSASVPYADGSANGSIYWTVGNTLIYHLPTDITGQWNHFAFVSSVSNNYMAIYMDGSLVQSNAGALAFNQSPSSLGIGPPPFTGDLSEFRVWNVARTGQQILQNMNNPLPPNTPGMVAYYRFNDYLSGTYADSSSDNDPATNAGFYPYPAWVAAPTNFENYVVPAYSTNFAIYLPGFVQNDTTPSSLVWSLVQTDNLNGSLTQATNGEWLYTPNITGGSASFTFAVNTGPGTLSATNKINITVASLNPPILSPIGNQLTQQGYPTAPILFTITDTNIPVSQLNVSFFADNTELVNNSSFNYTVVTNNGTTNETIVLVITPVAGAIGSANITLYVTDGRSPASESFVLQVNQAPAYTIIDLGVLVGSASSYGTGINNLGQVVGYCTQGNSGQSGRQAFYYTGFGASQQTIALETNASHASVAYAVNDNGVITGTAQNTNGSSQAFVYDTLGGAVPVSLGALGTNSAGSASTGYGININGTVVGSSTTQTNGQLDAFMSEANLVNLGLPGTNVATGINNAGQIVGYIVTNNVTNAFILTPTAANGVAASTNYLGFLPGGTNSMANGINQVGDVVGASVLNNGFPHAWLKVSIGSPVDLGTPTNMLGATAYGLNSFDQVVGTATPGNGITHAFLYSTGHMNDLNNLIPYEQTNIWTLTDARGINDQGAIVGTGLMNGSTHAFLALPAWVIGQPIARPLGTVAQTPAWTVTSGPTTASSQFFWDANNLQLYAIVPCTAVIQWPTSFLNPINPTNTTPPIVTVSQSVWPRIAQTHVVGTPVQVAPQGLPSDQPFNYSFQSILYSTTLGASVDANNVFTCLTNAYSVLQYLTLIPGQRPDPINSASVFQVVRSVSWNDPNYLSNNTPAIIGTPITNATHFDYAGRNGYVYFQKSVYDGLPTDPNRAYDLPTRTGPIIPVNTVNPNLAVPDQPLVVVWYHTNNIGVAWADSPYEYIPQWPASIDPTNTIVIASLQGSGQNGLPATYLNPFAYYQNDPTQPGFNPNEEHALVAGGVFYALRNDLNALYKNLSLPYALLKYQDAANNNQWTIRVFAVVATNATTTFTYTGTAGTEIQPPLPLSLMQLCTASNTGSAGPYYHAQVDGSLWAKAAGPNGASTNLILRYWYPLQPGFYYNTNVSLGACIPWLDGGTGTPVPVTYVISWPTNGFGMPVGQTLTSATGGLPDITDLLNASIIYDSLNPSGASTSTTNLARLYDPFTARSVPVPASATWPDTMNFNNVNGVYQFADLPYYLQVRLIYDPINKLLSYQGLMAPTTPAAAPILLNNVMSIREREEIKGLDGDTDTTEFDGLIDQLYNLTRNPNMLTLDPPGVSTNNYDDALLIGLTAETNFITHNVTNGQNNVTTVTSAVVTIGPQNFGSNPKALTTGLFGVPPPQPNPPGSTNYPPEYITVVQDDPSVPGSVVQMYVIQVTNGLALGNLAVLEGNNAFDQRLTLRHTDDFGGDPDPFQFQYYYQGDVNGTSPPLPVVDQYGNISSINGWLLYQPPNVSTDTNGYGANDITLGEGGQSGLLVMSDNWFISRYIGYNIDGSTNWSGWIGAPGGGAQLAPGWITRVLGGLNPFDARTSDFHTDPIDTYQSMLEQAGPPYEGPVALNSDPTYINSLGLIEAYETVLQLGESLSIDGTPPVDYEPANSALQEVAGQISSLDVVLGNEAYAEFSDPTIGFTTGSTYGSLASSIFAFEDQVDTLLDQELDLLHGRDDTETTVTAPPVYNRLYWNFTGGNGQVAYVSTFNITDVNGDGFINAADAQIMFPQGHGDAWGYYLSALTVYYDLLRNPNFTWVPRPTTILLAGVPVTVNYQDEQAFAHAAAQKAQTGASVVQLTYESAYVANPAGQYQGYEDTDTNRAWGLSEWARRAGQGAFFDWLTVNALIPAVDPNTNDTGLALVDRATVTDISAIPPAYTTLQNELDEADAGLNPLGLTTQSVPFDIDPTLIDAGKTHFEQIYGRAVTAMVNAVAVWNQANEFTSALRQEQDTVQQFSQNATAQDQAYQSRLIEIFGYPYAGDIGQPGSTYPQGYTGPDLYHYMYVDMSSLDSAVEQPTNSVAASYLALEGPNAPFFQNDVPAAYPLTTNNLQVSFPIGNSANLFQPPASWGSRQAPGTIQMAAMTLLQDQIRMQEAVANYNALLTQIQNNINLLQAQFNLNTSNTTIESGAVTTAANLNTAATVFLGVGVGLGQAASTVDEVQNVALESVPGVEGLADDAFAPLRGTITAAANATKGALNDASGVSETIGLSMETAAQVIENQAQTQIAANTLGYQMEAQVTALQNQITQEPALRLECYNQNETIIQDLGSYQAALAQGEQVLQQRCTFAEQTAAQTEAYRYQDMTFRIFQNDAIQKYEAQFALAQRYVYMAAIAYDFETDLLGGSTGSGQEFLTSIIQEQSLGEMDGTNPVAGVTGLADPLEQMGQDFAVLKGQLGFNNPQTETGKFSLRYSLFRQQMDETNAIPINGAFTNDWQTELQNHVVPDLWQIPEFVRYCRPFAPQSAGPQPGMVISFGTTITYGLNFFGWPLAGGDSAYDPTLFTTKVRSVGVWFDGYDNSGLSTTPRIYLIPVGSDLMRSPTDGLTVRQWRVQDQAIPVPFQLGASTLATANYIPMNNSLSGTLNQIRQFSSFLGYTDQSAEIDPTEVTTDSRQIGRSVWNTQWMLIIPGGTLLADPNAGLQDFINSVSDIKIFFQTYAYSGD